LQGPDLKEYKQSATRISKEEVGNYLFSGLLAHMDMEEQNHF
jgi:hypothetical protein